MPNPRSRRGPDFSDLADDVLHLVCEEIYATSRISLLVLARVCRRLNEIVIPYIFRDVRLTCGLEGTQERMAYEQLVRHLQGESGIKLARHVRRLLVNDIESAETLGAILRMCENLQVFSWHCHEAFPASVLQILRVSWPRVKIEVRNHRSDHDLGMNEALLASPQLHALEYVILKKKNADLELKQLLNLLQVGGHCKSLHIDTRRIGRQHMNILSPPGFRVFIPSLEDVAFIQNEYHIGNWHLKPLISLLLADHKLKILDLPPWLHAYNHDFISSHLGFQNLQYFKTSITWFGWNEMAMLSDWLYHAPDLRGLFIENFTERLDNEAWKGLRKHKNSLRELILPRSQGCRTVSPPASRQVGLHPDDLIVISKEFTALERLGLDVPIVQEGFSSMKETKLDEAYLAPIKTMNLKALDLYVCLPGDQETTFAPEQIPNQLSKGGINVDATTRVALSLTDDISGAQHRPLQTLAMHFCCLVGRDEKEAKIQLKRIDRHSIKTLGSNNVQVIVRDEWRTPGQWKLEDLRAFKFPAEEIY